MAVFWANMMHYQARSWHFFWQVFLQVFWQNFEKLEM
jgi:hypothetical protein